MMLVLTINAGSSSLKTALYQRQGAHWQPLSQSHISGLTQAEPQCQWQEHERVVKEPLPWLGQQTQSERAKAALDHLFSHWRSKGWLAQVQVVGHRVVHGGQRYQQPIRVTKAVLAELRTFNSLAPLHQPYNLQLLELAAEALPGVAQVACFDTMFHAAMPKVATRFAIPRELTQQGILRYGFHGLSYAYVYQQLQQLSPRQAQGKVIICHLGAGASMCAIKNGQSIASTMGFTAVEGLPMGSRSGSLDPGVLVHLMREHGWDAQRLEQFLYKECGWFGMSGGISSEMKNLRASQDPRAEEAIEVFIYRCVREIGSLVAALQGLDALVFTGGVGEHDAQTRTEILQQLGWLGVQTDELANQQHQLHLHTESSRVGVWVIPTNEELMLVQHASACISSAG